MMSPSLVFTFSTYSCYRKMLMRLTFVEAKHKIKLKWDFCGSTIRTVLPLREPDTSSSTLLDNLSTIPPWKPGFCVIVISFEYCVFTLFFSAWPLFAHILILEEVKVNLWRSFKTLKHLYRHSDHEQAEEVWKMLIENLIWCWCRITEGRGRWIWQKLTWWKQCRRQTPTSAPRGQCPPGNKAFFNEKTFQPSHLVFQLFEYLFNHLLYCCNL